MHKGEQASVAAKYLSHFPEPVFDHLVTAQWLRMVAHVAA
jgi:hypothetical protein